MATVLHLTSTSSQFWCHSRGDGWRAVDEPPDGPVWVLADVAEENFAEIQIPRIFGRDRQAFIARQLANRFADTPFRTTLPIQSSGSVMERLAPPRQTLLGLDAARRINTALDALSNPVAGVWSMSMLLAHLGCTKNSPSDLFVVLPSAEDMRIVFVKNRTPVLGRLIPHVAQGADQAIEISRTLRHLENIRLLERTGGRYGVLVLGDTHGMTDILATEKLDLLPLPAPWVTSPPADWRFALFDLVLTSPAGQLAPLARRAPYLAARLRQPVYVSMALVVCLSAAFSLNNLRDSMALRSSQTLQDDRLRNLSTQLGEVEQKMARFSVPADLVRQAVLLQQTEISSAPSFATHLQQLGQAIGQQDAVRLKQLAWRIVPPGQPGCTGAAPPTAVNAGEPQRMVEISFDATLPAQLPARARAQSIAALSALLSRWEGVTLLQNPAQGLAQATLSGGSAESATEETLHWCLTLPGQSHDSPSTRTPTGQP